MKNHDEIINSRSCHASIANTFDVEIPIADSSEIGFREEVNVRRDACSKGSASIDGGDPWYAPRHLLHHAHHVAPTELWPTHGRAPTHPWRERRRRENRIPFPSKVHTNGICSTHLARCARPPIAANYNLLAGAGVFAAFQRPDIPDWAARYRSFFIQVCTHHNSITFDLLLTRVQENIKIKYMFPQ